MLSTFSVLDPAGWPHFVTIASTSVSLSHPMLTSTHSLRRKLLTVTLQDDETPTETQLSILQCILSCTNLPPPLAESESRLL